MRAVLICCVAAVCLSGVWGQGAGGASLLSNPMMMMGLLGGGEFNMGDMMRFQMMSSMFRGRGTGSAAGGSASAGSEATGQSSGGSGGAGGMCSGPNRMMNMICLRTMMSAFN